MEKILISNDIPVFGLRVKSFPNGIDEAFQKLKAMPDGDKRSYYGISGFSTADGMLYYAMAEDKKHGESKNTGFEKFKIPKGTYQAIKLTDWRKKAEKIKWLFDRLLQDPKVDNRQPGIEWYKNNDEMYCMVQIRA